MQPAVLKSAFGLFGVVPVAGHHIRTVNEYLPAPGLIRVNHLHLHPGNRLPHTVRLVVLAGVGRDYRRSLAESVSGKKSDPQRLETGHHLRWSRGAAR